MSRNKQLPNKSADPATWYQEVVARAELAEHSPVKGCMVMRPDGYALWENIHDELNPLIKNHGASNVSFPIFIPESYLAREKDHVEGFSPEIAVVTYAGGEELQEKLVVRPTSETIIHESMKNWIKSYKDLPLKINQWCNVVRWEKRPRLFLRTSEFQWQEGHTAHATAEEAHAEVQEVLELYYNFCRDVLAIPTIMGRKSEKEKFAGAVESYSIEGLMPDGRALQMGTVHYLGDNFSKMAGVQFLDKDNNLKNAIMTSWGVSTRLIGAVIMVHGDDKGLVLPPRVAATQIVIVPIGEEVIGYAQGIKAELKDRFRVRIDDRNLRPGAKFYDSELRGVPLRIEVGPEEMHRGELVVAHRLDGKKEILKRGPMLTARLLELLHNIEGQMLENAEKDLRKRIIRTDTIEDFRDVIENGRGFAKAPWCNTTDCELSIKEATSAVSRNMPLSEQINQLDCKCIWCSRPATKIAYFSKAY